MSKKTNLSMCMVMLVFLLGMACTAAGQIIYVDYNAPGFIHDGISWRTAYNFLQDALAVAQPGNEIWVAKCSYRPDEDTAHPTGTGDRNATFVLKNDVAIYGGFPSPGDPNYPEWFGRDPNMLDRDPDKFVTTLSGDLSENDFQVADPCDLWNQPTRAENSWHVVNSSWNQATAILDGFCISGGNANVEGDAGGGMYISFSNATVANCTFCRNSAYYGGGMYNVHWNYSPTMRNCTFNGNWANNSGGGMYNGESVPTLIECIFGDNSAGMQGGGMYNSGSRPTLRHCTFSGNKARDGGGMHNFTSSPDVNNCKFTANSARASGGGINNNASTPELGNCTFACNSAGHDGAGMSNWDNSIAELVNCILWDEPPSEIYQEPGSIVTITYSDIRGGWTGEGNIDKDPCFVDCSGRLSSNSPCIDAGDSNAVPSGIWTDANDNPRFVDDPDTADSGVGTPPIVDMGVYEFQDDVFKPGECYPQTYSTYGYWIAFGKPNCWCGMYGNPRWPYQCDGDADNLVQGLPKYRVYTDDFNILVANWKKPPTDPTFNPCADFDHKPQGLPKYRVYTNDFNILVRNWKKTDDQLPDHCPRPE